MTTPYENSHSGLLNRLAQQADALADKAGAWASHRADAQAEAVAAEGIFLSDFSPANARTLAEAKNKERDLTHVSNAVESAGGPKEVRARALRTPAVFSTFAKGFSERAAEINKRIPVALKRLGERRAELTQHGRHSTLIETDALVTQLRSYHGELVVALAAAVYGETYAAKRGVSHEPRTFDDLLRTLTAPLPEAPPIPSA